MSSPDRTPNPNQARRPLPRHVQEFQSANGLSEAAVSPYGGQVWRWAVNGIDILLPLNSAHSISNDRRPRPNPPRVGETTGPGGTWVSCGGGKVRDKDGTVVSEAPVHGPFSSPSNLQRLQLAGGNAILDGGVIGTEPFFLPGVRVGLRREVAVSDGARGSDGALVITNTLTNLAGKAVALPPTVEHAYFVSQAAKVDESSGERIVKPSAGILNAHGGLTYPEQLKHEDPGNGNAIDGYLRADVTGTPGRCVFLPDGVGDRVVVIDAVVMRASGDVLPVSRFDVYRAKDNDPWTAIEPAMTEVTLEPGESVSVQTTVHAFETIEAYYAAQAA